MGSPLETKMKTWKKIELESVDKEKLKAVLKLSSGRLQEIKIYADTYNHHDGRFTFSLKNKWFEILDDKNAEEMKHWDVKAKCEKCKIVSHYFKQSGITIPDRSCLECGGPVVRTSNLFKAKAHLYEGEK